MKKLFMSCAVLALSTALFAQKKLADAVEFKSETIDLGKIKVANPATATFIVTNKSAEPLVIEQANPTCGCTIGDYTKAPIAPGKDGWIKATYNAANIGSFDKHMTVKFAGFEETKSITIKGEVLSADDWAKLKGETVAPPAPAATTGAMTAADSKTKTADTKMKTKEVSKTDSKTTTVKAKSATKSTAKGKKTKAKSTTTTTTTATPAAKP